MRGESRTGTPIFPPAQFIPHPEGPAPSTAWHALLLRTAGADRLSQPGDPPPCCSQCRASLPVGGTPFPGERPRAGRRWLLCDASGGAHLMAAGLWDGFQDAPGVPSHGSLDDPPPLGWCTHGQPGCRCSPALCSSEAAGPTHPLPPPALPTHGPLPAPPPTLVRHVPMPPLTTSLHCLSPACALPLFPTGSHPTSRPHAPPRLPCGWITLGAWTTHYPCATQPQSLFAGPRCGRGCTPLVCFLFPSLSSFTVPPRPLSPLSSSDG